MKIVIIIADITRTGGTERATINLANMLCEENDITILSLGKQGSAFFPLKKEVLIHFLNVQEIPQVLSKKVSWYYTFVRQAKNFFAEQNADILIGQGHNISTFLSFFKFSKTKIYACEHIDYNSIPRMSKLMINFFYPKLDGLVVLSDIAKSKVKSLNSNTIIIPNTLPFETEIISGQNSKDLIMVGRISQEKGYERLIPIAQKLLIDFPDWTINIYGDGELKSELQELFRNRGLTNIVIHNPVKNIMKKYIESSMLLMTSFNEAMPMVILEANHCGLPVIGFRNEGTESLIKNNGFIVDTDDEFYLRLKMLIENKEMRVTIGENARNFSEQFKKKNIKEKWIEFLK